MRHDAVTAVRIERGMDRLAQIIVERGEGGSDLLPMYRRLEEALAAERENERLLSEVVARAGRSSIDRSCRRKGL